MQISVKHLPKSLVELTVTCPPGALDPYRAKAIAEISKQVTVPGFRAGHAPEAKVIERVGEGAIVQESSELALRVLYAEAVKAEKLAVVTRPTVEITSIEPFTFKATVAVLPEVEPGDYKKIKLTKPEVKMTEKEFEDVVAELSKRHAVARPITDRAAQKGDRVEIDFAGKTPDGVPLDGTESKHHPLTLGEGNFIPGFEEALIGMNPGEIKEHTVTFPADYHAKHLASKPVVFSFTLHTIEELVPPAKDDELATKVKGQAATWKELEQELRTHIAKEKEENAQLKLEDDLMQELLKVAKVDLPDVLIDEEVGYMLDDLKHRIKHGGLSFPDYLAKANKTEEALKSEMRADAESRVKIRLLVNKLIELEKPEVTEPEIAAEIAKIQAKYPEDQHAKIAAALASLTAEGARLRQQLKVTKLLKTLTHTLSS